MKPTQKQVIVWAREAGDDWSNTLPSDKEVLTRLATLAYEAGRKDENEACAKLCDSFQARDVGMQPAECAGAIRARREQ